MAIIIIAKDSPMRTMTNEILVVRSAIFAECIIKERANSPPVDEATMSVTTGRSQTAVIFGIECSCRTILYNADIKTRQPGKE
jgi:hypothetical protein